MIRSRVRGYYVLLSVRVKEKDLRNGADIAEEVGRIKLGLERLKLGEVVPVGKVRASVALVAEVSLVIVRRKGSHPRGPVCLAFFVFPVLLGRLSKVAHARPHFFIPSLDPWLDKNPVILKEAIAVSIYLMKQWIVFLDLGLATYALASRQVSEFNPRLRAH